MPLFPEEIGHPVILLRMVPDETKNCPFVGDEGCIVYDDRPWSCRTFPLEPIVGSDTLEFEIVRRDFCRGFDEGKNQSILRWRTGQSLGVYEEMNEEWKKVTHHRDFSSQNLLEGHARDIFFLGSYNLDEFRNVVATGDFQKHFDIDRKTVKALKASDTELLKFAFRWTRQVLFGEETLKRK